MVDPVFLYAGLAGALFFLVGLEELPIAFNVERTTLKIERKARVRHVLPTEELDRVRRQTKNGARLLLLFALASLTIVVVYLRPASFGQYGIVTFATVLMLGLFFLSFAYFVWAPKLLARVAARLEARPATANSDLRDAPATDGGRPGLP